MSHPKWDSWRWLWRRLAGQRKLLLACIFFAFAESLAYPPIAWLLRRILDTAIPAKNIYQLMLLGFCIVACQVLASALSLGTRFLSTRAAKSSVEAIRRLMLQRCFELPRSAHDDLDRGTLHSLFVHDTQLLDVMVNECVAVLMPSAIISFLLGAILAMLNARLLGILLLTGPILYLVNVRLKSVSLTWVKRSRDSFSLFSSGMYFVLHKLDLTRYQSAERAEIRRQNERIQQQRIDSERMVWLQAAYTQIQSSIVALSSVLILVIGGLQVVSGKISLGSLLSFYVLFVLLGSNLQKVFGAIPHLLAGNQALRALYSFYSQQAPPPYSGTKPIDFRGAIELSGVSFRYKTRTVLNNLSLKLDPQSSTAIMGSNGGGKTTIARLILGLYSPNQGALLADGLPYEQLDIDQLRTFMAFAPQDPVLFAGTIWENVSYGSQDSDADSVMDFCKVALVDNFARPLPHGYQTEVGEDGIALSGGQRQKIAIARALARRPQLLILDEPTNHLDPMSAKQILHNVKTISEGPTLLIITQDAAVAREAEKCYCLENGFLTEVENNGAIKSEVISERSF
ncbi:MAG: ABC transporter ATP-binding protein [Formivibrio sp.]|nr:ABC transporter ATP-binding protein [Formivibrio sp.]